MRWGLVTVLLCGCYAPTVPSGVPCSADGACPGDQECVAGICGGSIANIDAPSIDAPIDLDAPDAPDLGWSVPVLVPQLSTQTDDFGPSLFENGLRIYVATDNGNSGSHRIHYASRSSTMVQFSSLQLAGELDQAGEEEYDPEVSRAGLELHFASTATPSGLRQTTRNSTGTSWGGAAPIAINDREGPSLGVSDTRLLVSQKTGGIDEYSRTVAAGGWIFVRTHPTLNDMMYPGISADGLEVYATREGTEHLYRATRTSLDDPFGAPVRVLFGSSLDNRPIYDPELSADGRTMYLAINAGTGYDIYVTTR